MHKIGVIGDQDSILCFKALGVDVFPVVEPEQIKSTLAQLVKEQYAVVFITEKAADNIMHIIDEYKSRVLPAIILIPNHEGSLGIGMQNMKRAVEKAVGADILFEEGR